MIMRKIIILSIAGLTTFAPAAVCVEEPDDTTRTLQTVTVKARGGVRKLKGSAMATEVISSSELRRAACCNLGESFTTNPSVDVSYSDAATGARQIKLLGLSGSYVQMLTENIPNFRGVASPFGLGYVAGPWMQSIQVSKGASSVKNGYESVTGQINIEMLKPQSEEQVNLNAFVGSMGKIELNADGNIHLGDKWSGGLLGHFENSPYGHDGNKDGFADMPKVRQIALMNRWIYRSEKRAFQIGVKCLAEKRRSGQHGKHAESQKPAGGSAALPFAHDDFHDGVHPDRLYKINIDTKRLEVFTKNAYFFDPENDGNIALIISGNYHDMNSLYGMRQCDIRQAELYGSLILEKKFDVHALSAGLSGNFDGFWRKYNLKWASPDFDSTQDTTPNRNLTHEGVGGTYAQYTFSPSEQLVLMGGVRYDYNSLYGSLVTPRFHARWNPRKWLSLHGSAGIGRRSPHPVEEFHNLLASSREFVISDRLDMEKAWNFGIGANLDFKIGERNLQFSAEYYYTDFSNQLVADLDTDPHQVRIYSSRLPSRSHSLQLEATVDIIPYMTLTAAWRYNDVKVDYGKGLVLKPLTSRTKSLLSWGYKPMMGLWSFDATCSLSGGGNMPTPYKVGDGLSWNRTFKAYATLNAQITRTFRHFSVYIGGENLTNYRQKNPVINSYAPWSRDFDATMVYGPLEGAMAYIGFRYYFVKD